MHEDIVRLMQSGDFDTAIELLNEVIADDLENYDAILAVAISLLESGRPEEGKRALDYYHTQTPPTYESLEALGIYYIRTDDADNAEFFLKKSLELQPENGNVRRNLAMVYLIQNRWDEAEQELKQAIALDPLNYLTQIAVAQFKLFHGELQAASDILNSILTSPIELPPDKAAFILGMLAELDEMISRK